jgi:hypothetical protein
MSWGEVRYGQNIASRFRKIFFYHINFYLMTFPNQGIRVVLKLSNFPLVYVDSSALCNKAIFNFGSATATRNYDIKVCFVSLSFCLSVFPSFRLSAFLSFCLSVFLSFCLSVFLSFCLSVSLSLCLSVCLSSLWSFLFHFNFFQSNNTWIWTNLTQFSYVTQYSCQDEMGGKFNK